MDPTFHAILDSLPSKPPAPLEPYRELIHEMRRRGQTYREIAQVLAERFQIQVDLGAIHDLVKPRRKRKPGPKEPRPVSTPAVHKPEAAGPKGYDSLPRPVAAFEGRPFPVTNKRPVFEYDENEPLRLISNSKTGE